MEDGMLLNQVAVS